MNRKVVAIVSLLLAFCFVFVACDVDLPSDVSWGFDDEYHWGKANGQEAKEPHEFDGGKVTKAPTATEDGITTYTCNICKYERKVAVHPVAKDWSTNAMEHWHTVTCGHDVVVDKGAHEFHNGVCKVCGYFSLVGMLTERFRGAFGGDIGLSVDGLYMRDINIGDYGPGKVNRSYFPSAEARLWLDDNSGLNVFVYLVAVKDSSLAVSGGTKDEFQLRKDGYIYAVNGKIYSEYLGDDASFTSDFDKAIYSTTFKICDKAGFSVYSFEHLLSAVNEVITPYRAVLETLAKNLPNLLENIDLGGDGDGELPFITKKTVDGSTVYGIDYDVFEEANKELSTMTAQQFVDKLLGEGFVASLPGKLDELGKMTVGEVLDSIAKLGIDIDSLLEVARAVVAALPNVAEDTTLEDLIGQLIGVNKKFDLDELLHNDAVRKMTVANAITAAQDGNKNEITYAEITKGILDQVELYKNKNVYELLAEFMHAAISNSKYIYEYINEFIQILRWFDIEAHVNDGILQKIVINGGIEPYGNDDVATSTEQARARESLGNLRYIADRIGGKITIGPADEVTTCDAKTKAAEMLAYRQKLPDAPESKAQAESLFEALMGRKPTKEDNLREVDGEWYYDEMYEEDFSVYDEDWSNPIRIDGKEVRVVKKGTIAFRLNNATLASNDWNMGLRSELHSNPTSVLAKCSSQIYLGWTYMGEGTVQLTYTVDGEPVTASQLAWLKENYPSIIKDSEPIDRSHYDSVVFDFDNRLFISIDDAKHDLKLIGERKRPDSCGYFVKNNYKCELCGQTCVEYERLNHDIERTVSLVEGSTDCEDGVLIVESCRVCKNEISRTIENYHYGVSETISASGECYHRIEIIKCACGKEKSLLINDTESAVYIVGYTNCTADELAQGVTYKCPYCDNFEIIASGRFLSTDEEISCEALIEITAKVICEGKTVFEDTYEERITQHLFSDTQYVLFGTSCTEGWALRQTCIVPNCGQTRDLDTSFRHQIGNREVLATFICDESKKHEIVKESCLCDNVQKFSCFADEDCIYSGPGDKEFLQCGMKVTYTFSESESSSCYKQQHYIYKIYNGDEFVIEVEINDLLSMHIYNERYELVGSNCEEGVRRILKCVICGDETYRIQYEHVMTDYVYEFNDVGCKEGWTRHAKCAVEGCGYESPEEEYGEEHQLNTVAEEYFVCTNGKVHRYLYRLCGCGYIDEFTDYSLDGGCNIREAKDEWWLYDCGVSVSKSKYDNKKEGCLYETVITYKLGMGDTCFRQFDHVESLGYFHSWNTTYTRTGETCADGILVTNVCSVCGETETYTTIGNDNGHLLGDELTVKMNGDSCTDGWGYAMHCRVEGCDYWAFSGEESYEHTPERFYQIQDITCPAGKHSFSVGVCACGKSVAIENYYSTCSEIDHKYETGIETIVYDCGCTLVKTSYETKIDDCNSLSIGNYKLTNGNEVLFDVDEKLFKYDHDYEEIDAEFLNVSNCESGVTVVRHCKKCNIITKDIVYSHQYRYYTIPDGDSCEDGLIYVEDCAREGCSLPKNEMSMPGSPYHEIKTYADFEYTCSNGKDHRFDFQSCPCHEESYFNYFNDSCDGKDSLDETGIWTMTYDCNIKIVSEPISSKTNGCVTEEVVKYRVYAGDKLIVEQEMIFKHSEHSFKYTYTMTGSSCEDGVARHGTCIFCGTVRENQWYEPWHQMRLVSTLKGDKCTDGGTYRYRCIVEGCDYEESSYDFNRHEEHDLQENYEYIYHGLRAIRSGCACHEVFEWQFDENSYTNKKMLTETDVLYITKDGNTVLLRANLLYCGYDVSDNTYEYMIDMDGERHDYAA